MRHSKRTVLTTDDVDSVLSLRNVEPVYGFASRDSLRFKRAIGHKDLFYFDDRGVDFKEVIEVTLPKVPLDTSVLVHWLAIEGVRPAIPENIPVQALVAPSESKKPEHEKEDGVPVDIRLPVKHVLSRELQIYYDIVTELIVSKSESAPFKEVLASLAKDFGIHPLVPYFSFFVADEVNRSLNDLSLLFALMRVVQSLLRNPHIHVEPYSHQLMPSIMTCIVAKKLGHRISDNHWELRDFSANLAASLCRRFGHVYHSFQSQVTKTLVNAFLDPSKSLTQHYGAIQGLAALGPNVVRLLVLPNLETYMQLLEPEMLLEKQKIEMKRKEAWRVHGALLCAAGKCLCLYERLKFFPGLLFPPKRLLLKTNGKVATSRTNKQKLSDNHSQQQPPFKKLAADGSMGSLQPIAIPTKRQGAADGFPSPAFETGFGPSSASVQMSNEASAHGSREKGGNRAPKKSSILAQAWKQLFFHQYMSCLVKAYFHFFSHRRFLSFSSVQRSLSSEEILISWLPIKVALESRLALAP